jgi:16S rRNA processing protein RimM
VYAEPLDDPDALWVHELIGAEVVEVSGRARGICVAVVANPAADLLELDSGALVPVVFVTGRDDGTIVIDPPEGLFEDVE